MWSNFQSIQSHWDSYILCNGEGYSLVFMQNSRMTWACKSSISMQTWKEPTTWNSTLKQRKLLNVCLQGGHTFLQWRNGSLEVIWHFNNFWISCCYCFLLAMMNALTTVTFREKIFLWLVIIGNWCSLSHSQSGAEIKGMYFTNP